MLNLCKHAVFLFICCFIFVSSPTCLSLRVIATITLQAKRAGGFCLGISAGWRERWEGWKWVYHRLPVTLGGQRDDSGPGSERAGSQVHGHFGFSLSWGRASRSPWLVVPPASATPSTPLWGAPARTSPTPGSVPGWDQPATGLGRWESQPDSRTQIS